MIIVAGPCGVESRSQLFAVVEALSKMPCVGMVRCGVWKPRTHPGGFEGLGEVALKYMAECKAVYPGVRFCCEVATAEHAELALRYGLDCVWIGGRTTANPFMVQEVADALRHVDVDVWVKNAPMPDVELWLGAVERFENAAVRGVGAIHRGFYSYNNSSFRNEPRWNVPIELRRRRPDLPLLCDPSHIAGRRDRIAAVAQAALDMDVDGLMVEVHPDPQQALTDAAQQLTPEDFGSLVASLVVHDDSSDAQQQLRPLRSQIDDIDTQLLQLLADRMGVSRGIAGVKKSFNMPVLQSGRWQQLLADRLRHAAQLGLDPDFVKQLYELIHTESIRVQEK